MTTKRNGYAIYLRKSRKDFELEAIGQGETLARHKAALLELAERKGLKVVKTYEEMASAESIADRPQMQMLLDEVCAGTYAGVLVMEVERLARGNTRDQGEVAEAFAMSNTLIVTPSKTYDPSDEFDEEYFEFGLFMSRREYKTIRRRMQRGIMASVNEGNFIGSVAPYGYDAIRVNKKERILVPNDDAKNVRLMFDWFVKERMSCGQIARRLTISGIYPPNSNEWNRTSVFGVLKNVVYTGKIRWQSRKTFREIEDGVKIKKRRRMPNEECIIVDGKHQPIISNEIFEEAQSLFEGNVPIKSNMPLSNVFASILVCKKCGRTMVYILGRGGTRDRMTHQNTVICKVKSAAYEDVMDIVIASLKAHIEDFELKMTDDHEKHDAEMREELLKSMEAEFKKAEQRRDKLFEFFESGIYTKDEFVSRKIAANERIEAMKAEIETLRATIPLKVDYAEKIIKFHEVIDLLEDGDATPKDKNDALKEIIAKIEYDCIDLGRQRGGEILLDIHLKE